MVNEALEAAFAVARRDAASPVGPPPPAALRPVIRFNRLPQRALSTVRDVVDHDEVADDRVVIDASGVTYFGSRGLRMLVQFRFRSHREVIVVNAPKELRRVLVISGLDQLFELR